jgi:hypothetical protein
MYDTFARYQYNALSTKSTYMICFAYVLSRNAFPSLSNINALIKDEYDARLKQSIHSAILMESLQNCVEFDRNIYHIIQQRKMYEPCKISE